LSVGALTIDNKRLSMVIAFSPQSSLMMHRASGRLKSCSELSEANPSSVKTAIDLREHKPIGLDAIAGIN
jgi:hypothetical protein